MFKAVSQFLCVALVAITPITAATAEPALDFKPLFNGKSLDGWVNINTAPSTWSVRDGMIYCTGAPIGELRTEKMYQNFVLELEWRHLKPKGNAGIFVWADDITAKGQPFHRGVEVQVLDGQEGDWFTSQGDIFPIHGARMTPLNGRGGDRAFPTENRSKPSPEWNHYRITCNKGDIQLEVNGKVVTQGRNCSPSKGYICLESEGSPVEFRNLRIAELPESPIDAADIAVEDRGFTSLYNGLDLSGWKVLPGLVDHWKPNDWVLAYDGKATGDVRDLWTEKEYGDVELIVDWRFPEPAKTTTARPIVLASGEHEKDAAGKEKSIEVPVADSGIYFRGSTDAQVNIWQWPIGSGEIWSVRTAEASTPEMRSAATPKRHADAPVGEWNRFHIILMKDEISVDLNGTRVIEGCRIPGIPNRGPIGLQNHGDPIEFANIYVRELTPNR